LVGYQVAAALVRVNRVDDAFWQYIPVFTFHSPVIWGSWEPVCIRQKLSNDFYRWVRITVWK
jgi:hypothetical protein